MNNLSYRLKDETSPYLLQHANNPVDWYPWGDAAFAKAVSENKPVFLSIGYSTCHWCHVMAHESFEDEEVAALLNQHFVSVKVDREERSDIDSVYMNVCQAMNGHGGWPLTILMTPDKKPFFAGTYFPKNSGFNQMGLMDLLQSVSKKWQEERHVLFEISESVTTAVAASVQEAVEDNNGNVSEDALLHNAYEYFCRTFDIKHGGFGSAPKFPSPHNLMFLLAYGNYSKDETIRNQSRLMAEKTLEGMYSGGLYDHVGFGFSRYSTDAKWLVPHFEKMLYDNALLIIAYCEAYEENKNEIYRFAAESTIEYILREMVHPDGGFYSAQDADSEGEEGKFYTFSKGEILKVLGVTEGTGFCQTYGVTAKGNFEGKNILNRIKTGNLEVPDENTLKTLQTLREYRLKRTVLHKDDKILTAWNGLMIAAFAKAGQVFRNDSYIRTAEKALSFIENKLTRPDGRLYISFREGQSKGDGLLDDYGFLLWGCIALYESSFNPRYLRKALELVRIVREQFADKLGGYFLNPAQSDELFYRPKELYDGALPSGNSVMAYCLVKLARLTGDVTLIKEAKNQLIFITSRLSETPSACVFALKGMIIQLGNTQDLVCVVNNLDELEDLSLNPESIAIHVITPENSNELIEIVPYLKDYAVHGKKPAFFLCENHSCQAPVYTISELVQLLDSK